MVSFGMSQSWFSVWFWVSKFVLVGNLWFNWVSSLFHHLPWRVVLVTPELLSSVWLFVSSVKFRCSFLVFPLFIFKVSSLCLVLVCCLSHVSCNLSHQDLSLLSMGSLCSHLCIRSLHLDSNSTSCILDTCKCEIYIWMKMQIQEFYMKGTVGLWQSFASHWAPLKFFGQSNLGLLSCVVSRLIQKVFLYIHISI